MSGLIFSEKKKKKNRMSSATNFVWRSKRVCRLSSLFPFNQRTDKNISQMEACLNHRRFHMGKRFCPSRLADNGGCCVISSSYSLRNDIIIVSML